jgi:serine/threonine protein kinase
MTFLFASAFATIADMWATGILLFEMLALRVPFEARSLHELTKKIIKSPTPRIPAEYQVRRPHALCIVQIN